MDVRYRTGFGAASLFHFQIELHECLSHRRPPCKAARTDFSRARRAGGPPVGGPKFHDFGYFLESLDLRTLIPAKELF
jgi:hypothetical protein